jgi:outer membrane receptor for ferrienterochelin and colicins
MNSPILTLLLPFIFIFSIRAQDREDILKGRVFEQTQNAQLSPLVGANVYWKDTRTGVISDTDGRFVLQRDSSTSYLVISFVGYRNDTINTSDSSFFTVVLKEGIELKEVTVVHRQQSTQISTIDPIKIEKINEKELLKAACCNLSESFETNPSVDVSYTDAVTGTKQIQMLGLAGPYTQITRENIPDVRGLSAVYGLTYIPGPWISGIMLNKGTGSVANGYESIAGQIDVHLRDPEDMDRFYINLYGNEDSRLEANAAVKSALNEHVKTALLVHASNSSMRNDRNHDGFLDMPLSKQYMALNRWEYNNDKGLHAEIGIKGLYVNNLGGEMDFHTPEDKGSSAIWGMNLVMKRMEGWAKTGRTNPEKPYQSMGIQVSGVLHQQHSFFGLNTYDAGQQSFYANFLYQSIIGTTAHKFRAGASFQYDHFNEVLNASDFKREEIVPGAFFEYTYSYLEKFNAVVGARVDYHNNFGLFMTPRLHLRYAVNDKTIIRASGGRGQRTASIIAENNALLASSRQIIIKGEDADTPYGLKPEIAWNYGINVTRLFTLDYRPGTISLDYYHTWFRNQVVIDLDQSPQQALFYNLDGRSYSNSFQVQFDYEMLKRFDVRLAYRLYDVQTTYSGTIMQRPLVSRNRAFVNLAYETRKYWKFDATVNGQGTKRIPATGSNPEAYRLPQQSPGYMMLNLHISKTWREKFEAYAGVENLLNYRQSDPILASDDPFGPYFDSSMVWGPVFGRNIYAGLRLRIK